MVLQVSVAVLLDNFVAASARLEKEIKEEAARVRSSVPKLTAWRIRNRLLLA